ncbi:MAG: glutamate 5-kinase [Candidatus Nanopelagicales bacterium]
MSPHEQLRARIGSARRVVVKTGSSSLTTSAGQIDATRVNGLVDVVAEQVKSGRQVVLVSSGAIAAGIGPLGLTKRPGDLATQQAAASVGQGVLVGAYAARFAEHGLTVGQVLLTADDIGRRAHYRNAQRTLTRLLDLGVVPIVNENDTVATEEIRFGDNDQLAALVAHVVHADALILLSDVDGLYDGPPSRAGSAVVSDIRSTADLNAVSIGGSASSVGRGGMATKVKAASTATAAGVPVVLTSARQAREAMTGGHVGTLFYPTGKRRPTRLLWLAHASEARGTIFLDEGAVRAIVERKASLLPAGVTSATGEFVAGDPVDLADPRGVVFARGIINFDASELPPLLGKSTRELSSTLGVEYERELVHRDDLVILSD